MDKKFSNDIDKIKLELTGSEQDLSLSNRKSLKYCVAGIHSILIEWSKIDRYSKENDYAALRSLLALIGVVGVILAITRSAGSDIDWIREHTLAFRLWGVTLCLIFVGASIERATSLKLVWSFTATKILLSILFSGLLLFSKGKASGFINDIFSVDASVLPITLVFTTALVVFKTLIPLLIALAILLGVINLLTVLNWFFDYRNDRVDSSSLPMYEFLYFIVLAVITYYALSWHNNELSDRRVGEKIYLIAQALEFNKSHQCSNVDLSLPVVFIGASQESVLVAPYSLEDFDFATFFESTVVVPTDFKRVKCDYSDKSVRLHGA